VKLAPQLNLRLKKLVHPYAMQLQLLHAEHAKALVQSIQTHGTTPHKPLQSLLLPVTLGPTLVLQTVALPLATALRSKNL
jgi:hypothetical protein